MGPCTLNLRIVRAAQFAEDCRRLQEAIAEAVERVQAEPEPSWAAVAQLAAARGRLAAVLPLLDTTPEIVKLTAPRLAA